MPSPFTHLHIAEKIRSATYDLNIDADGRAAELFRIGWSSFCFGSVAPDFQTISGQPREDTHFFKLPPQPHNKAYTKMFAKFPQLAKGNILPINQTAFIAGYSAHLLLDLIWFREVLIPFFHDAPGLGEIENRRLIHLILLTYIDETARAQLIDDMGKTLAGCRPSAWLPFASDEHLIRWQQFLIAQLQPNGMSETVRIYAGRLQMTPQEFADKLNDQGWMQDQLFSKVPVDQVFEIIYSAVNKSITLVRKYVNGDFAN